MRNRKAKQTNSIHEIWAKPFHLWTSDDYRVLIQHTEAEHKKILAETASIELRIRTSDFQFLFENSDFKVVAADAVIQSSRRDVINPNEVLFSIKQGRRHRWSRMRVVMNPKQKEAISIHHLN